MLEGPGDDAPLSGGIVDALHGEALAAAGLPVREDGAIVALQHTLGQIETVSLSDSTNSMVLYLDQSEADVVVDLLGGGVLGIHLHQSQLSIKSADQ